MIKQKNTGLIACGTMVGTAQPPYGTLLQGYQLKKIFIADGTPGSTVLNRYPHVEVVPNPQAILDDSSIDHVLVSGPAAQHKHLIGAALRAGKHVQVI